MQTVFLFVLNGGDHRSMKLSETVVDWIDEHLSLLNAGGAKIFIKDVDVEDAKKPTVQKFLKGKYGFTEFPALYFAAADGQPPATFSDWNVIRKQLMPIVEYGREVEAKKMEGISAAPDSFEQYLRSDLNEEAMANDGKGDDDDDDGRLNSTSIQKAMSQFQMSRPKKSRPGGGPEAPSTPGGRLRPGSQVAPRDDNIGPQPLPPVTRPKKSDPDDDIMSAFMMNNIDAGLDFN